MRIEAVWASGLALTGLVVLGAMNAPKPPRAADLPPGTTFVNFESPHVHPLDMTPDGQTLLVANTAACRVDVFSLASGLPVWTGQVAVGLDPVTVRARTNTEVWVVNHVSDSVSIVDLTSMNVVATIDTDDEPCDVVFAGAPQRAFVSCQTDNKVLVFDPANLAAAPTTIVIDAECPRSLAVSPDGMKVYAAVFESGNGTTVLGGGVDETQEHGIVSFPPNAVSHASGPYGGVNPPPNDGANFNPPIAVGNENPPPVSLIVRKNDQGQWLDDNGADWTDMVSGPNAALSGRPVGWDMPDRDLAVIDTGTLGVTYATRLMNICMAVGVNPQTGAITVVGTDATNEVRFEPNLTGVFLRVNMGTVDAGNLSNTAVVDLNPHLDYQTSSVAMTERIKSIGDPRAVVWNAAGTKGYVAGMGSDNVIVIDTAGARAGLAPTIDVGEGPTGLALDPVNDQLYVLNRFSATVSVVNLTGEYEVVAVPFFDPTPAAVKNGRKHLYNTHLHSGLGHVSCASCHVDARMDRLGWDLGDPSGAWVPYTGNNAGFGVPLLEPNTTDPLYADYHPMKGPMTTQTLQDSLLHEPLHWRGDRAKIEDFGASFFALQGADAPLAGQDMQDFKEFLKTITYPPNPYRAFDNTIPQDLPLPGHYKTGRYAGAAGDPLGNGNAFNGISYFRNRTRKVDGGRFACVTCHTLPSGTGPDLTWDGAQYQPIAVGPDGEHHLGCVTVGGVTNITMKVPHLRNLYKKVGMNMFHTTSNAGFGYGHDGTIDTISRFINMEEFELANDQETADGTAFMLSFSGSALPVQNMTTLLEPPGVPSRDVPASVGTQVTLAGAPTAPQTTLINAMYTQANLNRVGMIVTGRVAGEQRGYMYLGSATWKSDRAAEATLTSAQVLALAGAGNEITFTVVPIGSQERLGIDGDLDGCYNGDEGVTCGCLSDFIADGFVTGDDFDAFVDMFVIGDPSADMNGDTFVTGDDFDLFVDHFSAGC